MRSLKWFTGLFVALLIAGCGVAETRAPDLSMPTAAPPLPKSPAAPIPAAPPTALPIPADDAIPVPTFLPVERITLKLNDVTWSLRQPKGIDPVAAAGDQGILWIYFPAMATDDARAHYGLEPSPHGLYFIMYTPFQPGGGDLEQKGWRIATLPDTTVGADEDLYRLSVSAIIGHRFLIHGYSLCSGCQNGGTEHFWVADPRLAGSAEAVTSIAAVPGEGGGHFLAMAHNERWLFWDQFELRGDSDPLQAEAHAFLIDLRTWHRREINLGKNRAIEESSCRWGADGKLHFRSWHESAEHTLDPETGKIDP
jgi:hypothetical protein